MLVRITSPVNLMICQSAVSVPQAGHMLAYILTIKQPFGTGLLFFCASWQCESACRVKLQRYPQSFGTQAVQAICLCHEWFQVSYTIS